jgi:hypothetical protein
VDGAPIVAIATDGTRNRKTGSMIQIWILRADVNPVEAVLTGADRSVCGACPLRSRDGLRGRGCYVQVQDAPAAVWRAYRAGKYRPILVSTMTRPRNRAP